MNKNEEPQKREVDLDQGNYNEKVEGNYNEKIGRDYIEKQNNYYLWKNLPKLYKGDKETIRLWNEKLANYRRELKKKFIFLRFFLPIQWKEVGVITFALILSLLPPLQDLLLDSRLFVQARYRKVTNQISPQVESPLLLVQIDNDSLKKDKVTRYPIDYSYLGKLVEKSSNLGAKVVGIDYVLDQDKEQPENSQKLTDEISQAEETQFVFATIYSEDSNKGSVSKEIVTIDSQRYHKGNIDFLPWYVELPDYSNDSTLQPFAHQIALAYSCFVYNSSHVNGLQLNSKSSKNCNLLSTSNDLTRFLYSLELYPISHFFQWFQPIIDFSIPPEKAYQTLSACEFLETCKTQSPIPESLESQIVLIAAGGYEEAGVKQEGEDNFPIPSAISFWRGLSEENFPDKFPGGEAHAYMIHHFLTKRLVIPIPDFLMVLLAVLLGKKVFLILLNNPRQQRQWLIVLGSAMVIYIWIGLQFYIWLGVLIPFLLPSGIFGNYIRLALRRKSSGGMQN